MFDLDILGDELARMVRDHSAQINAPVLEQIKALQNSIAAMPAPKDGRDGKDSDPEFIRSEVAKAVAAIPVPKDGISVHPDTVSLMVRESLSKAVAALPAPVDVEALVNDVVKRIPVPRDGRDGKDAPAVDTDAVAASVLAKMPIPKDGRDGRDGANGKDGHSVTLTEVSMLVQAAVKDIPAAVPGRDGKDGAAGLSGKDGAHGQKGDTGPVGVTGEQGIQGAPGANGTSGRDGKNGDTGSPGKDADPEVIKAMIEDGVFRALPSAVQKALDVMLPQIVQRAAELIPKPADGAPGRDGTNGAQGKDADTSEIVAKLLPLMPEPRDGVDGRDGKDAAPIDTDAIIENIIKRIPVPKDGKDASPGRDGTDGKSIGIDDIRTVLDCEIAKGLLGLERRATDTLQRAVESMPKPKDGEKGEPGSDGKSITADDVRSILEGEIAKGVLDLERRATDAVHRAVDRLHQPKDGVNGRDGISLDDFDAKMDGRMLTLSMRCGERTVERTIKLEIPMDKGIFRSGRSHEKSDVVTFGGSQWIALKDTDTTPPSDAWRLCVSKGKDGKDAK